MANVPGRSDRAWLASPCIAWTMKRRTHGQSRLYAALVFSPKFSLELFHFRHFHGKSGTMSPGFTFPAKNKQETSNEATAFNSGKDCYQAKLSEVIRTHPRLMAEFLWIKKNAKLSDELLFLPFCLQRSRYFVTISMVFDETQSRDVGGSIVVLPRPTRFYHKDDRFTWSP
jgi:hypothetical protein